MIAIQPDIAKHCFLYVQGQVVFQTLGLFDSSGGLQRDSSVVASWIINLLVGGSNLYPTEPAKFQNSFIYQF